MRTANLKSKTEIRDGLIRLLAEENLNVIRHAKPAAFFDLKSRTINVPNWDFEKLSATDAGTVMDVHEVLHALLTPDTHTVNATRNILEDIRIERIGKQKFPGIRQIFIEGYRQLFDTLNFFKLKNTPLSELNEMNFLDRLNLHAKVGFLLPLPLTFSPEETVLLKRAFKTETFDDILALEIDIKKLMKDQQSKTDTNGLVNSSSGNPGDSIEDEEEDSMYERSENIDSEQQEESDEDSEKEEEDGKKSADAGTDPARESMEDFPEPTSQTIDAFESSMDSILSEAVPIQLQVGSMTKEFIAAQKMPTVKELVAEYKFIPTGPVFPGSDVDDFESMIGSAKRSAQLLYKEFMLRKNAKERLFDTIKDSGKLDMKRIHLSAFTDNIFRQKTTMFKGANHGFVFLLDVSGSMSGARIRSTLNQLFIVTEFCRKASIKFKVYTFTAAHTRTINQPIIPEFDSGNVVTDRSNSLMNGIGHAGVLEVLSSTLSGNEYKNACRGLFFGLCIRHLSHNKYLSNNIYGGTATCSALFSIEAAAKQFFDENKIEKRNLILMSDGGAGDGFHASENASDEVATALNQRRRQKCIITDLKTKRSYHVNTEDDKSAIALNMVGNRIGAKTTLMQLASSVKEGVFTAPVLRKYIEQKYTITVSQFSAEQLYNACNSLQPGFTKQKFVKFTDHKYINSIYIIKMVKTEDTGDIDDMFEGQDVSKKSAAQIASKLVSSNKTEKASRILMQTMAESFN